MFYKSIYKMIDEKFRTYKENMLTDAVTVISSQEV